MKDLFINEEATIKEALKKLDKTAEKVLFVVDKNKSLLGTITDGDIRRYIIKTGSLEGYIKEIYNKTPIKICETEKQDKKKIKNIFISKKLNVIPVVNGKNQVIDYLTWAQIFSNEEEKRHLYKKSKLLDIPVVIMAGGKGTRLAPFTQVLPKPLIPVGRKTIVEHIIDNFKQFGINRFFLTLNYKGELIKAYFNGIEKDYQIEFVWEEDFLGTAGSLRLLEDKIEGDFIVSNCDILVKANYEEIYAFHKKNDSIFTSITAIQHYKIPYGVVRIKENGKIRNIEEKPEHTFQINTGVYFLNKETLKYIPKNKYLDMPDLIRKMIENNENVFAYPVNEGDYIDIGQWEEYKKNIKKLQIGFEDV